MDKSKPFRPNGSDWYASRPRPTLAQLRAKRRASVAPGRFPVWSDVDIDGALAKQAERREPKG